MLRQILKFSILFFLILNSLMGDESYCVQFCGDLDEELEYLLASSSQLVLLKESPITTETALKYRAEADIENFLKVLHSKALYNARIALSYDFTKNPFLVKVEVDKGLTYPLRSFQIEGCEITFSEIGIFLNTPAYPKVIIAAEEELLRILEERSFPLAQIKERKVIVDQSTCSVDVILAVDKGPTAYFGPTTISGTKNIKNVFFVHKIAWNEGDLFDPVKVEKTQNALEASGLFSSITLSHPDELMDDQFLPMNIELIEGKVRSLSGGLIYNTERGPGITGEWEHRNIRGLGEKLNLSTTLWHLTQEATLLYLKPDFLRANQDLIWLLEWQREHTRGYTESSLSLSNILERQVNDHLRVSFGGSFKILRDTRSDPNGRYNLFKLPMQVRWSDADSLLDPTVGKTINFKCIPSAQILHPQFAYCINTLTTTFYHPLTSDHRYVLANKLTLGSIWGSSHRTIPASERFYEGSENCLRGYRYLTVSPLNDDNKPIGGRSMMIYSTEFRWRFGENAGWVLFYELGNVYSEVLPQLDKKVLQSTGVGFRYHTPVGPLRVDFAVPLNRRPHLDHRFQIYLSIGQAF